MDELKDISVGELDVRLQLRKMLASERFQTKGVRANLLQYVVEQTLAGEVLTQEKIATALFSGFTVGADRHVRTNASYLRDDLSEYYAEEGKDDLVRIEIGNHYKVTFAYNPDNEIIALYYAGLYCLRLLTEENIEHAMRQFQHVVEIKADRMEEDFAPVYVAQAEALLWYEALHFLIGKSRSRGRLLDTSKVFELANRTRELDSKNWKAHIILGAYHCTQWDWIKASKSFDTAMSLNPVGVASNFWYALFLLVIGEQKKSLCIVEAIARSDLGNLNSRLVTGLFLYLTRHYLRASDHTVFAFGMDDKYWAPPFLHALIELALDIPRSAQWELDIAVYAIDSHEHDHLFPGFQTFIAHQEHNLGDVRHYRSRFMEVDYPSTFDKVMFFMAEGKNDEAVKELESLRERPCPIAFWLHLCPLFDPLRDTPEFKQLIAAMNLPNK